VIEHHLHRTLTLLDWVMLGHKSASFSQKEAASNPERFNMTSAE
jgi:hypothetical protein